MIDVLSKKQAQFLDIEVVRKKYITKKELMDNAGKLSAQFFVENIDNSFNQKVLVIAGKGDNGGDAIIMHSYLLDYGIDSKLYIIDSSLDNALIKNYKIPKNSILKKNQFKQFR